MISFIITTDCNQRCEYCFASGILSKKEYMALDQLETVYKFLDKSNNDEFHNFYSIIGGEPTLHPQFMEIVESISQRGSNYNTIFTNGTRLYQYAKNIPYNLFCTVNVNSPEKVGLKNYANTLTSIMELIRYEKPFRVGVNLFPGQENYDFIWNIIDEFNLSEIRVSVASPSGKYSSYQSKRDEYFNLMHDRFVNFCKEAVKRLCKINIDCNRIPLCYFTDSEQKLVKYATQREKDLYNLWYCPPNLEIYPDYSINSCLIFSKEIEKKTIFDFNTPEEAYQYLQLQTEKLYQGTAYGRCTNCIKRNEHLCQGGCLHFQK